MECAGLEIFKEKMQVFGPHGDFEEDEKVVMWTERSSKTTVEFKEANNTVYVTCNNLETMPEILAVVGDFFESISDGAQHGLEVSCRVRRRVRRRRTPSKAFAGGSLLAQKPHDLSCLNGVKQLKGAGSEKVPQVPYKRVVVKDFEKEDKDDLALSVGQHVTVEKDPEFAEDILDRWVFGKVDETGETGWFLLASTEDVAKNSSPSGIEDQNQSCPPDFAEAGT